MSDFQLVHVSELPVLSDLEQAAALAKDAARILEQSGESRADSAAWRLADALALLSQYGDALPGIHERTGRGAKLDYRAESDG